MLKQTLFELPSVALYIRFKNFHNNIHIKINLVWTDMSCHVYFFKKLSQQHIQLIYIAASQQMPWKNASQSGPKQTSNKHTISHQREQDFWRIHFGIHLLLVFYFSWDKEHSNWFLLEENVNKESWNLTKQVQGTVSCIIPFTHTTHKYNYWLKNTMGL